MGSIKFGFPLLKTRRKWDHVSNLILFPAVIEWMHMLDFFSICEVMELVPEEEAQSSAQACPNSFAD